MTDQATHVVAAGWYEDPASSDRVRWWNGAAWTDHTRDKPAARPQEQRDLEREVLYGGDAAAQSASENHTRRPRRSIEADRARIYAAHSSTGSVWLIALSPVLAVATAIAVGYFYFYTEPQPAILIALVLPYLLGLLWAVTDARKLRDWGFEPASAAWALLGALVYLIARRTKVKGSGPLVAFLVSFGLAAGIPAAAYAVGIAQPITSALQIQGTVRGELIASGQVQSVTCPPFAEATTVGTIYTCDAVLADGSKGSVIVSIDSSEGDFSYALGLH